MVRSFQLGQVAMFMTTLERCLDSLLKSNVPLELHQHHWYLVKTLFSIQNSKQIGDKVLYLPTKQTKW
jgi:CRISPR/Cas system-associated endonuclease Cas3-HD